MSDAVLQVKPDTGETVGSEPVLDPAADVAANEPLQSPDSTASKTTRGRPDWTDWQPPAPAIPPQQLTRVCSVCQTLNRDTAHYCRHCARKLLPQVGEEATRTPTNAAAAQQVASTSVDAWPPVRVQPRRKAPRRVLGIPVPAGVDVSIVWLLIGLAFLHLSFVLWYLGRSTTPVVPLSDPATGAWKAATAPEMPAQTVAPPAQSDPAVATQAEREPSPSSANRVESAPAVAPKDVQSEPPAMTLEAKSAPTEPPSQGVEAAPSPEAPLIQDDPAPARSAATPNPEPPPTTIAPPARPRKLPRRRPSMQCPRSFNLRSFPAHRLASRSLAPVRYPARHTRPLRPGKPCLVIATATTHLARRSA
jgi:hypothetical protein